MNEDTLSRYRLVERIGAGGMGEVGKAHDARLDRTVAIKMLLRGRLGPVSNDAGRERFRREALTLSRLSHAGIATVFDFDSEGDHEFLVMEFVTGGTLESRLREGPLPLVQIRSIGIAVADLDWIRFAPTRATGHSSVAWVSTMARCRIASLTTSRGPVTAPARSPWRGAARHCRGESSSATRQSTRRAAAAVPAT